MNKIAAVLAALIVVSAGPARAQSSSNTIVRLSIATQGTNFGHLDLELFDHEKPETVRNFLLYVYAGVYSNLVVHRTVTNFVMQAGRVILSNPDSGADFIGYTPGRNFGRITNEFSVGQRLSNTYGTIAMARISGDTNSASADWFINLNTNTNLDEMDGGFTVFGRVLESSAPDSGTNVLEYFRTTTNLTAVLTFAPFDFFSELAYSMRRYTYSTNEGTITTNQAGVQFRDLFTIDASVLNSSRPPDRRRPKVAVTDPIPKVRVVTNASLALAGIASDDMEVARVFYTFNNGQTEIADGTASWSEDLTLTPGTNVFLFKSIDWNGNESKPVRRSIFYQVPAQLKLTNTPGGQVFGFTNLQMLDIGRNYKIQAKPDKNNFFVGWRGSAFSSFTVVTFNMQEGTHLTAVFATNQFLVARGVYSGLIVPRPGSGTKFTAGKIYLRLGPKGQYAGRLETLRNSFPIRGVFNQQYSSAISGFRNQTIPIALFLTLHTNENNSITGIYTDGSNAGEVTLEREITEAALHAGDYTFMIEPATNSVIGDGFGFGQMHVDSAGAITASGTLQDGSAFSQSAPSLARLSWPLFSQSSESHALLGWLAHTETNGYTGSARWLHPAVTNASGEGATVTAFRYSPPAPGASPFPWTDGRITFSGGDLAQPLSADVSFSGDSVVVSPNDFNLSMTLSPDVGRITGTFTHPASQAATPFEAAIIQATNVAAGFFQGSGRSGAVWISARP